MVTEKRQITIVGCGPGSPAYLTQAAREAVESATALVGAKRLLELFPESSAPKIPLVTPIAETLDKMAEILNTSDVTVLVTGDPGFYSLSRPITERFNDYRIRIIPGISSAQAAFAALGLPWSSALTLSAHKRDPDMGYDAVLDHDPIAALAGREASLNWAMGLMKHEKAKDRVMFICENLTLPEERVFKVDMGRADGLRIHPNSVIVIASRGLLNW